MIPTVFLVDDDAAVRGGLSKLLTANGLAVRCYASAEEFLAAYRCADGGCLLLDLRLPGMSGLELQHALARAGADLPIVFLTGYGDVPSSVQAMRGGAVDFLEKPPSGEALLARVSAALALDEERRAARERRREMLARFEKLTAREREVLELAVAGVANKEIARRLGISHRTVETHRSRLLDKLNAETLLDLVEITRTCDLAPARRPAAPESPSGIVR